MYIYVAATNSTCVFYSNFECVGQFSVGTHNTNNRIFLAQLELNWNTAFVSATSCFVQIAKE